MENVKFTDLSPGQRHWLVKASLLKSGRVFPSGGPAVASVKALERKGLMTFSYENAGCPVGVITDAGRAMTALRSDP